MRSPRQCALLALILSLLVVGCAGRSPHPATRDGQRASARALGAELGAVLCLSRTQFRPGDPIDVEFYVWNARETDAVRLVGLPLPYPPEMGHERLPFKVEVRRGDKLCDHTGPVDHVGRLRPDDCVNLRPGSLYGVRFDLRKLYLDDLSEPGTYRVRVYYANAAQTGDGGPPLWTGRTGSPEVTFRVKKP